MNHGIARLTVFPAVVFASVAAHAQTVPDRPYYWHDGWGWGHMILGPLMMIVFIAVVIVVVVLAVRWLGGAGHGSVTIRAGHLATFVPAEDVGSHGKSRRVLPDLALFPAPDQK